MTGIGSSSTTFKVDTSGLQAAVASAAKASKKMYDSFKDDEKIKEEYNEAHTDVTEAFAVIAETEEPLDDDNFNTIINTLVVGEKTPLTTEETNYLKAIILVYMGYTADTNFAQLTEVDATKFLDILTQVTAGTNGTDNSLSAEELQGFLKDSGFQAEKKTESKDDSK